MSMKLSRDGYEKLIAENIEWLMKPPRTLEREHIIMIVKTSPDREYPPTRTCGCHVITCDACLMEQSAYRERNQP